MPLGSSNSLKLVYFLYQLIPVKSLASKAAEFGGNLLLQATTSGISVVAANITSGGKWKTNFLTLARNPKDALKLFLSPYTGIYNCLIYVMMSDSWTEMVARAGEVGVSFASSAIVAARLSEEANVFIATSYTAEMVKYYKRRTKNITLLLIVQNQLVKKSIPSNLKNRGGFLFGASQKNRLLKAVGDSPFLTRKQLKDIEFAKSFTAQCDINIKNMFYQRKQKYIPVQPVLVETFNNTINYGHYLITQSTFIISLVLSISSLMGIGCLLAVIFQNSERNRFIRNQNNFISNDDIIIDTEIVN